MTTSTSRDPELQARIDLRVSELELLAAQAAAVYWRERTERPLAERLREALTHRWPRP